MLVVLNINGANAFQPAGRLRDGIPLIPTPNLGSGIIDIAPQVAANSLESSYQRGYIQSWNFTFQKKLAWGFVGQAGYVTTRQINQVGFKELNYAPINGGNNGGNNGGILAAKFGRTAETRLVTPIGNSHYHSLQTSLERRFAAGMQLGIESIRYCVFLGTRKEKPTRYHSAAPQSVVGRGVLRSMLWQF